MTTAVAVAPATYTNLVPVTYTTPQTANKFKHVIGVTVDRGEAGVIFCGCKEDGSPSHLTEEQLMDGYTRTANYSQITCPDCGKASTLLLGAAKDYASEYVLEYAKLYDNGNKVSLSIGAGEYIYRGDIQKVIYKQIKNRFTFNSESGFTYFCRKGKVRNITSSRTHDYDKFLSLAERSGYEELIQQFYDLCFEKRGMRFVDKEKLVAMHYDHATPRLLLKYPILENFPTYHFGEFSKERKKAIGQATKINEVFEEFTGHGSKVIRKEVMESSAQLNVLVTWGSVIKEPANMQKILEASRFDSLENDFLHKSPVHVGNAFIHNNIGGFQFLKEMTCGNNETLMVNRAIRTKSQVKKYPETKLDEQGNKMIDSSKIEVIEAFSPRVFLNMADDIQRLYNQLKAAFNDYEMDYRGCYRKMHDIMTIEVNRLTSANQTIPYTEDTLKYNATVDGFEFRLAETTDRLRDLGRKLTICVGGYTNSAMQGHTTVLSMFFKGQYYACLEIRGGALAQAKTIYNHLPNEETVKTILKWAEQVGVDTQDAYDLSNPSDESVESVLRLPAEDELVLHVPEELTREGLGELREQYYEGALQGLPHENNAPGGGYQYRRPLAAPAPAQMYQQPVHQAPEYIAVDDILPF